MTKITSSHHFEIWLKTKDSNTASCLASRLCLRLLPNAYREIHATQSSIILQIFRMASLLWLTNKSKKAHENFNPDLVSFNPELFNAQKTAETFLFAFTSTFADDHSLAQLSTLKATSHFNIGDENWDEINSDIQFIEKNKDPSLLMDCPLWNIHKNHHLLSLWTKMREDLLSLNDHWGVWVNWYEDRLEGGLAPNDRPFLLELENHRIQLTNKDWEKGPSHINDKITKMEKDYRDLQHYFF